MTPPVFKIGSRAVVVTDTHCGLDGVQQADHRACALRCTTEGASLIFYDADREALYRIEYPSEELRFRVLNDFAGLPAWVQGRWDDQNLVVQLQAIFPPPKRLRAGPLAPAGDRP